MSGTRIGPTAAATAVWLVIAILVMKPTAQPPGIKSQRARFTGESSSRTIARSQPVARNT